MKIDDLTSKQLKRLKANLRIGIAKIETGGERNPYSALSGWKRYPKGHKNAGDIIEPKVRASSATGKYQFLKQWWNQNDHNIKDYIDNAGGLFGSTAGLTVEQGMELFRNNDELQDAYFDHYAEKVLIPQALNMMDKNPLNLSVGEMAGQFHLNKPSVARDSISSGKLVKATDTNVSGYKYIDIQRNAVKAAGLEPVTALTIIKEKQDQAAEDGTEVDLTPVEENVLKQNEKVITDFQKKEKAIKDLGLDNPEPLRKSLYKDIVKAGNRDIINDFIEKRDKENEIKHQQEIVDYNELKDVIEKVTLTHYKKNEKGFTGEGNFYIYNDEDREQVDKLSKKYPKLFRGIIDGKTNIIKINSKELFTLFTDQHENLTGDKITIALPEKTGSGRGAGGRGSGGRGPGKTTEKVERPKGEIGKRSTAKITDIFSFTDAISTKIELGLDDFKEEFKKTTIINEKDFPEETIIDKEEIEEEEESKKVKEEIEEEESKKDPQNPNKGLAEKYYKASLLLDSLTDDGFNYEPGKQKLNIDAIVGLSLGLIGNADAKKAKIPLRTEDVSEAMRNFTADLMNKSKEGLPAEIEAAMKAKLADAYQGGLANIVRASAGNRATVLGNLGQLEQAKTKGLVAIQVADYEAKDRAFAQYGKAIEYINDFDTRRDIANHGIKYREAYRKKLQGEKLAETGFAKMMEALKYQKENGPGSANDMFRSLLMQKMFGFDPKMKDDGSGTQVGSKSKYDLDKANSDIEFEKEKGLYERFQSLNPKQKLAYDNLLAQTKDRNVQGKFIDYLQANPDKDLSKNNMENLDLAIKDEDFGLLSLGRGAALRGEEKQLIPSIASIGIEELGITPDDFTLPKINTNGLLDTLKLGTNKLKGGDEYSNTQEEIEKLWPSRNAIAKPDGFSLTQEEIDKLWPERASENLQGLLNK